MRIVVNDVAAETGGALTILKDFYDYVVKFEKEHEWIFLLSDSYLEEQSHVKVRIYDEVKKSKWSRLRFDFIEGRKIEKELQPDLFFSLQNIVFWGVSTPQAVYMHQAIPFQKIKKYHWYRKNERKLWFYQGPIGMLIKRSLRKANYIVVQTEWIKKAILDCSKEMESKIDVVPPRIECVEAREDLEWDYRKFFSPISMESYKNVDCIYRACELLNGVYRVFITTNEKKARTNIENIGYISREKMYEMYRTATLIFPSYIETFGLPLAEAKNVGAVILASDCPFSHEILDGYENAYFFDPFKPEQLAELMRKVLTKQIQPQEIEQVQKEQKSWELVCQRLKETAKSKNR